MNLIMLAVACTIYVGDDNGGSVADYEQQLAEIEARGCLVVFDGVTGSAANILLGATRTCVENAPGTLFVFHRPEWSDGTTMTPAEFTYWTERIASYYPPPVREWFLKTVDNTKTIHTIKAPEMVRIGVSQCP